MPRAGFEPGSLSERLLEFDTRSKQLGHHGRLSNTLICPVVTPFDMAKTHNHEI